MPLIRVSDPVADELRDLQAARQRELGRMVTATEIQEMLLKAWKACRAEEPA
jgi:hypothetical protein